MPLRHIVWNHHAWIFEHHIYPQFKWQIMQKVWCTGMVLNEPNNTKQICYWVTQQVPVASFSISGVSASSRMSAQSLCHHHRRGWHPPTISNSPLAMTCFKINYWGNTLRWTCFWKVYRTKQLTALCWARFGRCLPGMCVRKTRKSVTNVTTLT